MKLKSRFKKLVSLASALGALSIPLKGIAAQTNSTVLQNIQAEIKALKAENQQLKKEIQEVKNSSVKPATGFYAAPYFGAKGVKVDFYGYVKIDGIWQDSAGVGTTYLLFALPKKVGEHDSYSTITFRQTRFGFLLKKPYKSFTLKGKIEMDFYTQSNDVEYRPWNPQHAPLRARIAYLEVDKGAWQFRAGQDWMIISQLYPHTSNFPAGTFMGNLGYRTTLIELARMVKVNDSKLKLQVALERPYNFGKLSENLVIFDNDPNNDYGMPGIEARIGYYTKLFNKKAMFALYGHYSGLEYKQNYKTLSGSLKTTSFSTGLEVTVPIPILTQFSPRISGELWYGQSLGGYYCGGVDQSTRFTIRLGNGTIIHTTNLSTFNKNTDTILDVQPIHATGGWVELGFKPVKKLNTWIGWGMDNPSDKDLEGVKGARLSQQMFYVHNLYRFVPELGVGLEYMRVKTHYRASDGGDGTINRFMLSFYYFF